MNKIELVKAAERNCQLARQALMFNPMVAQEYYEKVQHLQGILNMVMDFESHILNTLDVD
jgi:hypothetical protein